MIKKKRPDYRGFMLHLKDLDKYGIAYGINDLIELANKYRTPIPRFIGRRTPKLLMVKR